MPLQIVNSFSPICHLCDFFTHPALWQFPALHESTVLQLPRLLSGGMFSLYSHLTQASTGTATPNTIFFTADGRDHSGLYSPTSLLKQGHLRAQGTRLHPDGSGISPVREPPVPLGNLFQCLVAHTIKKSFLTLRCSFLYISFCPLPLVLVAGTPKKSLTPSSWHSPFTYFYKPPLPHRTKPALLSMTSSSPHLKPKSHSFSIPSDPLAALG